MSEESVRSAVQETTVLVSVMLANNETGIIQVSCVCVCVCVYVCVCVCVFVCLCVCVCV